MYPMTCSCPAGDADFAVLNATGGMMPVEWRSLLLLGDAPPPTRTHACTHARTHPPTRPPRCLAVSTAGVLLFSPVSPWAQHRPPASTLRPPAPAPASQVLDPLFPASPPAPATYISDNRGSPPLRSAYMYLMLDGESFGNSFFASSGSYGCGQVCACMCGCVCARTCVRACVRARPACSAWAMLGTGGAWQLRRDGSNICYAARLLQRPLTLIAQPAWVEACSTVPNRWP